MVTGILWVMFDWRFALITFVAVSLYLGFTVGFSAYPRAPAPHHERDRQ